MTAHSPRLVASSLLFLCLTAPQDTWAAVLSFAPDNEGFITTFLLTGPFRRPRRMSRKDFLRHPHLEKEAALQPAEGQRLPRYRRIRWRLHVSPKRKINLRALFSPRNRVAAYAYAELNAHQARQAVIRLGSDDGARLWLNGKLVFERQIKRKALIDNELIPVRLRQGRNRLLLKVEQGHGGWGFYLRLTDTQGHPLSNYRITLKVQKATEKRKRKLLQIPIYSRFRLKVLSKGYMLHQKVYLNAGHVSYEAPLTIRFSLKLGRRRWRAQPVKVSAGKLSQTPVLFKKFLSQRWRGRPKLTITVRGRRSRLIYRYTTRIYLFPGYLRSMRRSEAALARLRRDGRLKKSVPEASLASVEYLIQRAKRLIASQDPDFRHIREILNRARRFSRSMLRGRDPYKRRRGLFYKAYRSHYDGKAQHYSLYIPKSYRAKHRYPMVIGLHGYTNTTHVHCRRILGSSIKHLSHRAGERRLPRFRERRFIAACPWAYGHIAYRYIGERSIFRVIEEVSRHYNIDRNRIYLTGLSMGGLGTFEVGMHHADRFAGLIANCGAADTRIYDTVEKLPIRPWERQLVEARSAVLWAENGRGLPLYIAHGYRDGINPIRHSKVMDRAYRKLGYKVWARYDPDLGHNVWDRTYQKGKIWKRFLKYRRDPCPRHLVFRTAHYRYMSHHWVRFNEFEKLWSFARIEARLRDNGINATTKNLLHLTFMLACHRFDRKKPIRLLLDGQDIYHGKWRPELTVARSATSAPWALISRNASIVPCGNWTGSKRPGLSGPIEDMKFTRQLLVYGTQEPHSIAANRRAAQIGARYHSDADIRLAVKADTAVTAQDIRDYHLVLYGAPHTNAVYKRINVHLPVQFKGGTIRMGRHAFKGADVGLKMIYPNPLNPLKYVLINAGLTGLGTIAANYLPLWTPDFVVFDQRSTAPRYRKILEYRKVRAAGFFSRCWRLSDALTWFEKP